MNTRLGVGPGSIAVLVSACGMPACVPAGAWGHSSPTTQAGQPSQTAQQGVVNGAPLGYGQPSQTAQRVVVNGVPLGSDELRQLASLGVTPPAGAYWYDSASGLAGAQGGPTTGILPAGLRLGGPMQPDASGGTTGVFINGRQLPVQDLLAVQQLVGSAVAPGRYWLDGQGNSGYEGGPPVVNLRQRAQTAGSGGGIRRTPFGTVCSDGNCFYYNDPSSGSSVMGSGC